MNENRDIEEALRASLERHARQAPPPDLVAERVIRRAQFPEDAPARRWQWRTWALPAMAAASVAAVVIGIAATSVLGGHGKSLPPGSQSRSLSISSPASTPSTQATVTSAAPNNVGLAGFRVTDLTFVDLKDGWALGTAECLDGSGKRCTAMVRTTDGVHWHSVVNPGADVAGACAAGDPCIDHIRFANGSVGYAFGPSAFFMTTDGGKSWSQQSGGAEALETQNSDVIRVTSTGSGCPGPCNIGVETSPLGSKTWTKASLPVSGVGSVGAVSFDRSRHDAYLLVRRNPAGGAQNETSTLYRSTDDGATWQVRSEPCPQAGTAEVDSYAVAAGADGTVTVLCATRQAPQQWFVATSADAGASFTRRHGMISADTASVLAGDPNSVLVAGGTNGLSRSTDGGASWARAGDITGTVTFVGFENNKVGRCVTDNGRVIWTTTDAGLTWTPFRFP